MWKAKLKNNSIVSEKSHKWPEIKREIVDLEYHYKDIIFDFPRGVEHFQYKTASAPLSGGNAEIESQTIGFIKNGVKFSIKYDFKRNKVKIEAE